jgi:tripartite-type tricarboxylate transporter receptor subunit TctC
MLRRDFIRSVGATGCALAAGHSLAQNTPKGVVKLIVGFAPGGGSDVLARVIAPKLSALWGTQVIVENRAGATGMLGADLVAKAPADGLTLLLANMNTHAIAPGLFQHVPYDARGDFAPIIHIGSTPNILVGNTSQAPKTVAELVALCKSKPGTISFGSAGNGSIQHLALELFKIAAGIDGIHVPYKGSGAMLSDLIGGQINYSFDTMPSSTPHVQNGKLVALAQTQKQRSKTYPNLPTMEEAGFPGFDVSFWYGIAGPKKLPPEMVQQINADVNKVLAMPDVADRFERSGAGGGGGSPQKLASMIDVDLRKWAKVIKDANVKPDA